MGATTPGLVCSEHGNEHHAQRGMSTGTRGRGTRFSLSLGPAEALSQSTSSAKPQAPTSQAGAQGSVITQGEQVRAQVSGHPTHTAEGPFDRGTAEGA